MKVFVVVLTIFAIAFSVLVIGYAAQTTNWKALAEKSRQWALQEQATRQAIDSKTKIVVGELNKTIEELQNALAEKEEKINELTQKLQDLNNKLISAEGKIDSLTSQASQLTSINNAMNSERTVLQSQLDSLRKELAATRTDNLKLADENQKLHLQIKLYESQIRLLKEQNAVLEEKIEELRKKTFIAPAAEGVEPQIAVGRLLGKITSIHDDLAEISLGSAHGIKTGMELIAYRQDQYLGKIKITEVSETASVGEIFQKKPGVSIQVGDSVTDRLD